MKGKERAGRMAVRAALRATLLTIFAVLCQGLLGCGISSVSELIPTQDPPRIPDTFACDIHFSMEGLEGTARLEYPGRSEELRDTASAAAADGFGGMELSFSTPETLSGISILYLDGMAQVRIGEVQADFLTVPDGQGASLPDGALISVLAKAVGLAARSPKEGWTVNQEGEWCFAGNLLGDGDTAPERGEFQLTVSGDGLPISLTAGHAGISVRFSQAS